MIQAAVERDLEVIGEAAKPVSAGLKARHPEVLWSAAARMRDLLIHRYLKVDVEQVRSTIEKDLPRLKEQVDGLLTEILAERS